MFDNDSRKNNRSPITVIIYQYQLLSRNTRNTVTPYPAYPSCLLVNTVENTKNLAEYDLYNNLISIPNYTLVTFI